MCGVPLGTCCAMAHKEMEGEMKKEKKRERKRKWNLILSRYNHG